MTEPCRVSLDELAHDRQQVGLERQHESFAPFEKEHERWIEQRMEWLLRHSPTRTLQEIVGEGLVGNEPDICNAIADGDAVRFQEITVTAIKHYVRRVAESDYEEALPGIVADNAEAARIGAEAGEFS